MRKAALTYAENMKECSKEVGLYVHCYGFSEVNSLHIHILDMQNLGPAFELHRDKNCPLDAVIEVIQEEVQQMEKDMDDFADGIASPSFSVSRYGACPSTPSQGTLSYAPSIPNVVMA